MPYCTMAIIDVQSHEFGFIEFLANNNEQGGTHDATCQQGLIDPVRVNSLFDSTKIL